MSKFKKSFTIVLTIVVLSLIAFTGPGDRYFETAKNLDIFATLFKEVNAYYVDEVDPNKLVRTGIDAMLESLDPYTIFIPEDDLDDYRTLTTGQYGGIGALIATIDGKTVITMPHLGFPAYEAGLKIGDYIIEIDGVNVEGKNSAYISKLLKGQAQTNVNIKIKRYRETKPLEFAIKRKRITIDNVQYADLVSGDIGYIKLVDFTTGAGREVKDALEKLKTKGAEKIILDLKGNPGGLLNEAINVANVFIEKGSEIVSTKGKIKEWNKTYKALNNAVDIEIPLAVIIDGGSASASEIVSGVIQDYDRGILVGRKTFGKGLVQATRPLSYNAQLKITTAKYYIPSGRCIQAIDYTHRNADGSVGEIPDSLIMEFQTIHGRRVFDGGGLDPDFPVEIDDIAPIAISLARKGLMFNYATKFFYENPEIDSPKRFELSDKQYQEFVNWLSGKNYDYTTQVEMKLNELLEAVNESKHSKEVKDQISLLKSKVNHDKEKVLQQFKDEIKLYLQDEISSRYYLVVGEIESSITHDQDINEAIEILNNIEIYRSTLARK